MGTVSTPRLPSGSSGPQKYYAPADVEAYVAKVTKSVEVLHAQVREAERRAKQAEQALNDNPEAAGLSQSLDHARQVAEQTIAEAHAKAAQILRAAEDEAAAIVAEANAEVSRLLAGARDAASEVFDTGEARLLAAVSAFVEGSHILRGEMARLARSSGQT
jgi:cell division septum initiation protein DivIVA